MTTHWGQHKGVWHMFGNSWPQYFTACGIGLQMYLYPYISVALQSTPEDDEKYLTGTFGVVCQDCRKKQKELCKLVGRFIIR